MHCKMAVVGRQRTSENLLRLLLFTQAKQSECLHKQAVHLVLFCQVIIEHQEIGQDNQFLPYRLGAHRHSQSAC